MAYFDTKSHDFEITADDTRLMIEATADYGDSEIGWGSTCATLILDRDGMERLRRFIDAVLTEQL